MEGTQKIGKRKAEEILSEQIRSTASEAIGRSDLSKILELIGAESKETEAALKIITAEKLSECAIRSRRIARQQGRKITPSAVIIAADEAE
ncbi:MAG: hypothetical protein QXW10_00150 [Candidatus Micrarchaeaceae archaeon]